MLIFYMCHALDKISNVMNIQQKIQNYGLNVYKSHTTTFEPNLNNGHIWK